MEVGVNHCLQYQAKLVPRAFSSFKMADRRNPWSMPRLLNGSKNRGVFCHATHDEMAFSQVVSSIWQPCFFSCKLRPLLKQTKTFHRVLHEKILTNFWSHLAALARSFSDLPFWMRRRPWGRGWTKQKINSNNYGTLSKTTGGHGSRLKKSQKLSCSCYTHNPWELGTCSKSFGCSGNTERRFESHIALSVVPESRCPPMWWNHLYHMAPSCWWYHSEVLGPAEKTYNLIWYEGRNNSRITYYTQEAQMPGNNCFIKFSTYINTADFLATFFCRKKICNHSTWNLISL